MGSSSSLKHVYGLLNERETSRIAHSQNGLDKPFQRMSPEEVYYSVVNSNKNALDNRYSNIYAYDRTAVSVDGKYLNANVVRDEYGRWWVAAQAPIAETLHPFFYAIHSRAASKQPILGNGEPSRHRKTAILVQLTDWQEGGLTKAFPYLPELKPGEEKVFSGHGPDAYLQAVSSQWLPKSRSTLTELSLSMDDNDMIIWHYFYKEWPDHGVPQGEAVDALRRLVLQVEERREEAGGQDECEVWVHCSAGVGRTGTFIALSSLLHHSSMAAAANDSPLGPLPLKDKVARTVDNLREYRGMMVQRPEQLALIYQITKS